jgi:fibronectin-binding autotransporter adhesin
MSAPGFEAALGRAIRAGTISIFFLTASASHAQYTADFQTNTISGVTSNWVDNSFQGGYSVGSNTFADVLVIQDGGVLSNKVGYLGYAASSSNNTALVSGGGSAWSNGNSLVVGLSGSGNILVISNGGNVFSSDGNYKGSYVGHSSQSNIAMVSGTGSTWSSPGQIIIGNTRAGNSLVISNGGFVADSDGFVGFNGGGSNNVVVNGTGSIWSNGKDLYVGTSGGGNSLVIRNGGSVLSSNGYIGAAAGGPITMNGSVLVTGTGSLWTNRFDLRLGFAGSGNSLIVSNGGKVFSDNGYVGSFGSSNTTIVYGVGSSWNNSSDLYVGYMGRDNSLVIMFTTQVKNRDAYIGFNPASSNNSVRVLGDSHGLALTSWRAGILHVGEQGSGNSLVVSGSVVSATNIIVGVASSACDNLIQLDTDGILNVTNSAGLATLEVRRGKLVLNGGTLQVDRFVMTNACGLFVRNGGTLIVGTLVLDPALDADGDGLPNGWEQVYGLDPLSATGNDGPDGDPDGDGMSNAQEFQAGTNPLADIKSIAREGDDFRVTWGAAAGKTNALQRSAGGDDGSYSNNFADIFVVTNAARSVTNYLDMGAVTNFPAGYYRVRLVP